MSFLVSGPPPSSASEALQSVAAGRTSFLVREGLFYLIDVLIIPTLLAIYFALAGINRSRQLIATAFLLVGTTIDFAAGFSSPLQSLSNGYLEPTTDAQRAAFVAAAQTVLATNIATGYLVIFLTSIWGIITGSVMLRSVFGRRAAYLGMVAGIVGIVWSLGTPFSGAFSAIILAQFALLAVWFLAVGYKLGK